MFKRGRIVRHKKTGGEYVIVSDRADNMIIEATGKPAYAYTTIYGEPGPTWIRPADEMEDGRFESLTPNDRVEGRDAASSRRVPSHDGLCGNGNEGQKNEL